MLPFNNVIPSSKLDRFQIHGRKMYFHSSLFQNWTTRLHELALATRCNAYTILLQYSAWLFSTRRRIKSSTLTWRIRLEIKPRPTYATPNLEQGLTSGQQLYLHPLKVRALQKSSLKQPSIIVWRKIWKWGSPVGTLLDIWEKIPKKNIPNLWFRNIVRQLC